MIRLISVPATDISRQLEDQYAAALGRLPERDCGHLTTVGVVCAAHPDRVCCLACARRHAGTHDTTWEHTCDACGRVDRDMASAWVTLGYRTRGRTIPVHLTGLGTCMACYARMTGGGGVG